jgi:hypothetical protein
MAKAKKRVATRKKSSKRGKASAKPGRKRAAKRATPKEASPRLLLDNWAFTSKIEVK